MATSNRLDGRAEQQHRRRQREHAGILEQQTKGHAHCQPEDCRRIARADPRDDSAGDEQRRYGADARREQHDRKRCVAQ
jgi:hypothetical protein